MPGKKLTYKLAYDDDMREMAIIISSTEPIKPDVYIGALEAWLEYCRHHLHELYKSRPTLETNIDLN